MNTILVKLQDETGVQELQNGEHPEFSAGLAGSMA
jgi:hypothetical protein